MRRLLLLHGYAQNAKLFETRMSTIRKACEKDVEFIFLDAPYILENAEITRHALPLKLLQATETNDSSSAPDDALIPRAWWRPNEDRTVYLGLRKTLIFFSEWLRENKINGIFGFSQGAVLTSILAAILERPDSWSGFIINGKPIHPPLDFFILVSGYLPLDASLAHIFSTFAPKLKTPSLHIIGDTDVIAGGERSRALINAYDETTRRIERHEGGHAVPLSENWRKFFQEYITNFTSGVEIPSPESTTDNRSSRPRNTL